MSKLKDLVERLLNPRSRLGNVPGLASAAASGETPGGARGSLRPRDILTNIPLMLGTLIVLGLFALAVFGPAWAPINPYIAGQHILPHLDRETGEFIRPPLEPSDEFPLGTDQFGTDILSMLMHGARNTLVACAFITMVRVILGLALGAIAGWNEGKNSDRFIMGLIGMITSLPLLISTMILIFALDIRKGLPTFIIALSALGWTEIAQYIRSEFLVLRKMPYIEGARASGLNGLEIAVRHVIPNVLPQVLIITFLEMGAVLMLLGELGFVDVYIGGGSHIEMGGDPLSGGEIFTLMDVPEWGAMIANGIEWFRSKPHIIYPPATAVFISVLGFTALGEGLRELMKKHSLNTAFLLRKEMLAVIGGLTLATIFIMNNTGAAPWFAKVAQRFDGERAYQHAAALADMEGRGLGQAGGEQAAAYIADQFAEYGLAPGWRDDNYYYTYETEIVRPVEQPELTIYSPDGQSVSEFTYQLDFAYMIDGHGGSGEVQAPVTLVSFDTVQRRYDWEDFAGLDLRGRIILLVEGNAPTDFADEALIRGALGILWVTQQQAGELRSQLQLADPEQSYLAKPQLPIFRILPEVAEALLAQEGSNLSELLAQEREADQQGPGWFAYDFASQAHMSLTLGEPEAVAVPSVLAYKVGSDLDVGGELVVVYVSYDGLGIDPDGTVYAGANYQAAGIGILLEVARLWQEQAVDTRRTTLFAVWGGASLDESGFQDWVQNNNNFRHLLGPGFSTVRIAPQVLISLNNLDARNRSLLVHPNGSTQLFDLLRETGSETGVSIMLADTDTKFENLVATSRIRVWTEFAWQGSRLLPRDDDIELIDTDALQALGETIALTLTRIVRETQY